MGPHRKSLWIVGISVALSAGALLLPEQMIAGELEPPGAPASTMKTLDEIPPTWSRILPSAERFELVLNDEAVLDKETGLVWALDADVANATMTWENAVDYPRNVVIGGRKGWRLPTLSELSSLLDPSQTAPALPAGHPFVDIGMGWYWTSSRPATSPTAAWAVIVNTGGVTSAGTASSLYVWPVRGGQAE